MKKTITCLVTLLAMLFASNVSAADYAVTANQYARTSYASDTVKLDLSAVAASLGVTEDSLVTAISGQSAVLSVTYGEGETSSTYTTSSMGFWFNSDSAPVSWGTANGSVWFADLGASTGNLYFLVGQYPSVHDGLTDYSYTAHYTLTLGEKETTIDLTLNVNKFPEFATTLKITDLTILGEAEYIFEQDLRTSSKGDVHTIPVADMLSKLGYTDDEMAVSVYGVYSVAYNSDNDCASDEISRTYTGDNTPGWWFQNLLDEESGEASDECVSAEEGTDSKFYVDGMSCDGDSLSFTIGQEGGALEVGATPYTYIYLVKGANAYKIKVGLKTTDAVSISLNGMTKVGEMTFTHEYAVDETVKDKAADGYIQSYAKQTYEYDLNTILAAFQAAGCECAATDMVFACLADTSTKALDFFDTASAPTTSNGKTGSSNGFYMTFDGTCVDWGSTCECKVGFDKSSYGYLQFAWTGGSGGETVPADGTKCNASVYYIVNNKYYYEFKMDITFRAPVESGETSYTELTADEVQYYVDNSIAIYTYDETTNEYTEAFDVQEGVTYYVNADDYVQQTPEVTFKDCETVATETLNIQLNACCGSSRTISRYVDEDDASSGDNKHNVVTTFDETYVNSLIGTTDPAYYILEDADSAIEAVESFSNCELSSNDGGAWFTSEGYHGNYSGSQAGFSHKGCTIEWWKTGQNSDWVGTSTTTHIYLVNLATAKKIDYVITYTWVSTLVTVENVGEETIVLGGRNDGSAYQVEFSISHIAEALGMTEDEFGELAAWKATAESGNPSTANYVEPDGFAFSAEGRTVSDGSEIYYAGYNADDAVFSAYIIDDAVYDSDFTYTTPIYVDYGTKRYTINVVVTKDPSTYTGIKNVQTASAKSSAIYDLSGRSIANPAKGLYIQNGKKYIVK